MTPTLIFRISTAAIALHIVDAELVHTRSRLSALLVPLAIAALAAWLFPRLRTGFQAGLSLIFGALALVGAFAAQDVTGFLLVPAGLALLGLGVWLPWLDRGRGRWRNRVIAVVAGVVVGLFFVFPVGAALWTTGKHRTPIGTFAVPHRDVTFTTSDGVRLSGWYVPSHNGAAIVIVHGGGGDRDGARRHATLLARAGYGVLLYDARGRGRSQGSPDAYGWTWGPDVDAAVTFAEHQHGVRRVGALGLSTGADVLIAAASHRRDIRAVVADGATTESTSDVRHIGSAFDTAFFAVQYAAASVFENARPSKPLVELAAAARPTPFLFIASTWKVERQVAPLYARAAHGSLWRVDAGHTGGLREHPREYERRVVGFFDRNLR